MPVRRDRLVGPAARKVDVSLVMFMTRTHDPDAERCFRGAVLRTSRVTAALEYILHVCVCSIFVQLLLLLLLLFLSLLAAVAVCNPAYRPDKKLFDGLTF